MPRRIIQETDISDRKIVLWGPRDEDVWKTYCSCPKKISRDAENQTSAICKVFLETGRIPRKIVRVSGYLYKIKPWGYRIFGYFENSETIFVVVHCTEKKSQKNTNKIDDVIESAHKRMELAKKDRRYIE
ncbi:MAG: hypothetical protein BA863_04760 [Desulfovibrio sp. S3730MH75]|nr:MAG: hypothetical protein BA863_04760 [Desulfovibrio sp. S3730MH75]